MIADDRRAVASEKASSAAPFCITVSFVNPHDKQFFWAGSEGTFYEKLFAGPVAEAVHPGLQSVASEENPPPLGFPTHPAELGERTRSCPATASQTPSR